MKRAARDGESPRLFPTAAFGGFGPSRFRPTDEPVLGSRVRGASPARLHRGVRDLAPRMPGVYGMFDGRGKIIYIGKAKSLRARLMSYFREQSRDPKAGKIIERSRALAWEQTGDELAALLRELELIQRLRPRFNVLGLPGYSRHHYICIGRPPAPFASISKEPDARQSCYGPLTTRPRTEEAVRRLNDWFRLRDCPNTVPMAFADQAELFPLERAPKCLRFELGTCIGPCVGSCTRGEYGNNVRKLRGFLDGRDRSLLESLRKMMEEASERFAFEKATSLRDRLKSLEWLDGRLALLRRARTMNEFIYPLPGADGQTRWYLIHRGQVRAVLACPNSEAQRERAALAIQAAFSTEAAPTILGAGTVDSVLLVVAWFQRNPGERGKLMSRAEAAAALRPGEPEPPAAM